MTETIRASADDAEAALRKAVARLAAVPTGGVAELSDLYAWGWTLTVLAEAAERAAVLLGAQTQDLERRAALRDDAGVPPAQRVDRIVRQLAGIANQASDLRDAAARYHSEIGHVGLELPDDGSPE